MRRFEYPIHHTLVVAILTLLLAFPALADSDDLGSLKEEIQSLKQGQKRMQKQLDEITRLLKEKPTNKRKPPVRDLDNVTMNIGDDPSKGEDDAKLVLIEFSDYQCPFCARHTRKVFPQIERDYIKTGKIRYVFRDFPLERIHKQAFVAAQAANCAGDQEKYWEMHDRLFANRKNIEPLAQHAEAVGLDVDTFASCISSEKYAQEVRDDMAEGRKSGVRSTPTFIFGLVEGDGSKVKALRLARGALPYERLSQEIDALLKAHTK